MWSTTRPIGVKPSESFWRHVVYMQELGDLPELGTPIEVDGDENHYIAQVDANYTPRKVSTNDHGYTSSSPELLTARVRISPR